MNFRTIVPKTTQKRPFLDTNLAVKRARRIRTVQNLFLVMRVCFPELLDAGFQPQYKGY